MTSPDLWTMRPDSREFDPTVISRAAHNADAPYDQRTCEEYPWAAAARIRYLEHILKSSGLPIQHS